MSPQVAELAQNLSNLEFQKFYGEVVVKFEAGKIVAVKETRTYKLEAVK